MYVRTDIGVSEPRLGSIAERVQEQLAEHSLPTNIMGSIFGVVQPGGEIEELVALGYSGLTVALLDAVQGLTTCVTQSESQLQ